LVGLAVLLGWLLAHPRYLGFAGATLVLLLVAALFLGFGRRHRPRR